MIVRTAVRLNCAYAVHASTRIALNNGLSQTEVEALITHGPVTGIDPEIVLIARIADDIADRATLAENLLEAAIDRWVSDNSRKLILMLSWFNLVNRYENACRVPADLTRSWRGHPDQPRKPAGTLYGRIKRSRSVL